MRAVSFLQTLISLLSLLNIATALRLEIPASAKNPPPKCLREFIQDGQLVVVTVTTDETPKGQTLSMRIVDAFGNEYRKKDDIFGHFKVAFTAHASTAFDICFTNELQAGYRAEHGQKFVRDIELDVEAGAAARDWNAIQSAERLKPSEVQLRKVEEMIDEVTSELDYLIRREERLRDTNESTNRRVQNFSVLIILVLISVGLYQIYYLRNYFRSKHIL